MEDKNNYTSGFQDACEAMNDLDQVSCWICLGDKSDGDLKTFCSCPGRLVHEKCLARWCLQQAGREEEKKCRFCAVPMPDYRAILNPSPAPKTSAGRLPMIKVRYGQTVVVMPLQPGEAGKKMFERDVKKALNLPESHCLKINFECHAPGGSVTEKVKLEGMGTYDAAFWCASQTAAERAASKKKSSSTGGVPTSSPLKSAKIKSSSTGGVPPSSPLPANANSSSNGGAATAGGRSSSGPILTSGIRSSPSGAAGGGTAGSVQVSSTPAPLPPTGPKPRRMSLPGWQLGQAPVSGAAIASAASTIRAISSGGSFVVPSTSTTTTIVYPRIVKIHGDPGVLPRVAPPCRPHPAHLLPASAAAPEPLLEKGQESSDGGLCVAAMAAVASLAAAAASSAMMIQSSDHHNKMDSRRKSAANHDVVPRSGGARRGMMRRLSGLIFSSS
ncbi:hypothetical protein CEUSTIGMA_g12347.t1 [Chlamydomonas eustigma]|uniref:RING-CH-type domain-containing protein n=1 Tax=Chlamydomonas eustigma TaxID=1157962 RepID=A0A250XPF1_9CHLO|nr:hypothetical protein CEUSTIGMA_g12347.t1 [Chlamydomonas eustigma]|eukprot:GAX84926.1 hypothetical protein CEUSTIGMA_g12347.t1 [Chlamydomonas eustigma]